MSENMGGRKERGEGKRKEGKEGRRAFVGGRPRIGRTRDIDGWMDGLIDGCMAERQIDGGCRSPLPEMARSCVRKLSWMCDSDRVV